MRILIVEDEPELLEQLRLAFAAQRYEVETAPDGEAALDRLFGASFDLVLLDIMLPHRDGFNVLEEMRRAGMRTPVLILTARGEVENRVKGLDRGADDYLAKPFSMAELMARARALLRRQITQGVPLLAVEDVALDTVTREVTVADRPTELTPKEFSILEFLLYNTNRAVSRASLADHVWGEDFDPLTMSNTIDVHIKNLRRKIQDPRGRLLQTIRGVGYILRASRS
jgi:DNA-binding response OmpR family regulator